MLESRVLLWIAYAAAVPLDACPRTFRSDDLMDAAHRAEAEFAEQDVEGFTQAKTDVEQRLVCTSDPLSARDVVTIHGVLALGAFFAQDDARTKAAVSGMQMVSPSATFPVELVPEGSKLALLVSELSTTVHAPGPALLAIPDGWIEVNGAFSPHVTTDVAATLQRFDNQGVVLETRFWWPGESLGDWASTGAQATATEAVKKSASVRKERTPATKPVASVSVPTKMTTDVQIKQDKAIARHVALVSATGLAGIATGVIYALASGAHDQALDPEVPLQQAEAFRDQANGLTYAWIGTSVITGGLLATVAITW